MLGHWRPLFLRFQKGGKAVATGRRRFSAQRLRCGLIGVAVWVVAFLVTRYASLASIVAALSLPVLAVLLGEPWPIVVFASIAAVGVILLHRPNIARLRAGTGSRFRLRRARAV